MKSSVFQSNLYVNDQVVNTIQDLEPVRAGFEPGVQLTITTID
jgi:hypothetical protein